MDKKVIDNIAWWIPFKSLRNSFKELICNYNNKLNDLDNRFNNLDNKLNNLNNKLNNLDNKLNEIEQVIKYYNRTNITSIIEYENTYIEIFNLLNELNIKWAIYGATLLSVIRNKCLDPNMMDLDILIYSYDDLIKIKKVIEDSKFLFVVEEFYADDSLYQMHTYDGRTNVFIDICVCNYDGICLFAYIDKEKGIISKEKETTTYYNLTNEIYDFSEYLSDITIKNILSPFTQREIKYPIIKDYESHLYKFYGELWTVRQNNYSIYYSVDRLSERVERKFLIHHFKYGDKGYTNIKLVAVNNNLSNIVWKLN